MSDRILRAGVVGVGHLGRHHARILASVAGASLTAVVDTNEPRAREIAAGVGARAFTDARDIIGQVDLVSIAAPTEAHAEIACLFLERGIPVLVEKPLARSVTEADAIIAAAAKSGAVLAVGHTERFNPAVMAARPAVNDPGFVEVHRLGTFPERSLDIDVVFDLMIHDLDLVLSMVPSEVESIEAVGVPVLTDRADIANARIRFASGCVANVTASRISRDRTRKIRFFQRDAYISIDCGSREAEVYRLVRHPDRRPAIEGGRIEVSDSEPLRNELQDFVDAVRFGRQPLVGGADGRRAVALAAEITERMAACTRI
ncbi:MAG: Gfo/Idh/MocA family oxidoreductase [Acidobacteria bacterium]|nr:Gfo/Idh/MocA family oxidoreductase [Acidobacteriota bacterium]